MTNRLTLGIRPYDGVLPLCRGEVPLPGFELDVRETVFVPALVEGFIKREFDISEMSLAEAVYHMSRGEGGFTCVPVFPSRVFRFGHLFANVASGAGPESLRGRRIGFQRWVQTAGVWLRGQLAEEFGLSPSDTQWYVRASFHFGGQGKGEVTPRDGSVINYIDTGGDVQAETGYRDLLEGRVDITGVTDNQVPYLLADARARRLFPDYRERDVAYYRRTRIFPIMHVICVHSDVAERSPELPVQLFRAFAESKARARKLVAGIHTHMLAMLPAYLDDEARTFGGDPWRHGLEANRHVLEKFISYCYDQGVAATRIEAPQMFHPSTWTLEEGEG